MLDMAAADRMPIAAYHLPFPSTGYIAKQGSGYEFVPAYWQPSLSSQAGVAAATAEESRPPSGAVSFQLPLEHRKRRSSVLHSCVSARGRLWLGAARQARFRHARKNEP